MEQVDRYWLLIEALINKARSDELTRLNKAHSITDKDMARYIMERQAELNSSVEEGKMK
jgi:hypothetical protein